MRAGPGEDNRGVPRHRKQWSGEALPVEDIEEQLIGGLQQGKVLPAANRQGWGPCANPPATLPSCRPDPFHPPNPEPDPF
jgi:hypothetical protein